MLLYWGNAEAQCTCSISEKQHLWNIIWKESKRKDYFARGSKYSMCILAILPNSQEWLYVHTGHQPPFNFCFIILALPGVTIPVWYRKSKKVSGCWELPWTLSLVCHGSLVLPLLSHALLESARQSTSVSVVLLCSPRLESLLPFFGNLKQVTRRFPGSTSQGTDSSVKPQGHTWRRQQRPSDSFSTCVCQ